MGLPQTDHFKYGTSDRLACRCCGHAGVPQEALDKLEQVRKMYGHPMSITSGYRCLKHPEEAKKGAGSLHRHTTGFAFDVKVHGGAQRYLLVQAALRCGATGIGIGKDFIHIDFTDNPRVIWSY